MNFDVQVGYSSGHGFHARWTETRKPSGLGNPTPTYSSGLGNPTPTYSNGLGNPTPTTDFDCQSSLGVNLTVDLKVAGILCPLSALKVADTLRVPSASHALDIRHTECAYYFASVLIGLKTLPTRGYIRKLTVMTS